MQALADLRRELGVAEPPAPPPVDNPILTNNAVHPTAMVAPIPKKVMELVEKLDRAGIKVTEAIANGKNPFSDKQKFLKIACFFLLRFQGGVKREALELALMTGMDWSKGTAAAHALQASQLFQALGVATEMNGVIRRIGSM
jgi:hypothetical protein